MKPPVKYQGMSPECEILLMFALNDPEAEQPVALDDACDLLTQLRCRDRTKFVETFGAKVPVDKNLIKQFRDKFKEVFGKKIAANMEVEADYGQFLENLTDEVNAMETELDSQCPWLITILGIDWVKGFRELITYKENGRAKCETVDIGWGGVRTQPLPDEEKKEIAAKWGKADPEKLARQDAQSELEEDGLNRDDDDDDEEEGSMKEMAVGVVE